MKEGWNQTIDSNREAEFPSLAFPPTGQISSAPFLNMPSGDRTLRTFKSWSGADRTVSGEPGSSAPNRTSVEFHHIKPEYAEHSLSRALHEGRITPDDRALIEQHVAWVAVKSNISQGRINKLTFHLVKWRRFLNTFRTNSIEDIFAGIQRLKAARVNGHLYSQNTLRDDISVLKKFYLWMAKKGYIPISKEDLKEIKVPGGNPMTKTVGQMLSQEEISRQ